MIHATKARTRWASLALALAALLAVPSVHAQDNWIAPDKALHLAMGTGIAGAGTFVFDDARVGFALGCSAGVAKELYDRRRPDIHTFSWKDLAVTCLGAGMGAAGMRWMLTRQAGVTTLSFVQGF
ncbi:MAG: hypothetical protein ABL916_17580 [Burkholderiaceae bacterium]